MYILKPIEQFVPYAECNISQKLYGSTSTYISHAIYTDTLYMPHENMGGAW